MFALVHSGTFTMHMQAFLLWHFEWFIQLHWCETFSFHCLLTRIFYLPLLLECVCACVCVCTRMCAHVWVCVSVCVHTHICVFWGSSFLSSIFSTIYHLISSLGLQAISKILKSIFLHFLSWILLRHNFVSSHTLLLSGSGHILPELLYWVLSFSMLCITHGGILS